MDLKRSKLCHHELKNNIKNVNKNINIIEPKKKGKAKSMKNTSQKIEISKDLKEK